MHLDYGYNNEIPKRIEIRKESVYSILKDILNGKYHTISEVSNRYNVHEYVIRELVINHVHSTLFLTNKLSFPLIAIYNKIKTIPIEGVVHKINDLTPTDLKKMMCLDINQLPEDLKKLRKNFEDIAIYIRIKNKSNK